MLSGTAGLPYGSKLITFIGKKNSEVNYFSIVCICFFSTEKEYNKVLWTVICISFYF